MWKSRELTNDYHELSDLHSNQEEADTRMLLHAKYAASECLEINIVIQSPDTDVLVLCAAHFNSIAPKELWFRTGVKDHLCFIPIHEVCQQLSGRILKSLPAFHTLTGCDTTSTLSGIGKKKPWKVLMRSPVHQESLGLLGQQAEADEETVKKCKALYATFIPHISEIPAELSYDSRKQPLTQNLYHNLILQTT